MKLVVTGLSECSRIAARSARWWDSSSSEENRAKSSCWVGLGCAGVVRGGSTSSKEL
jgi:hypothetical protein